MERRKRIVSEQGDILDIAMLHNHIGCVMAAITFKSLPASLHRALKVRAARHKRSLNQEVISLLEEAVAPSHCIDVEAMLAETRRFRDSLNFKTTAGEIDTFKREGHA
ncbi:MAG TPA: hypothetical protein VGC39_05755 [Candidatus Methylacidiphilales bacterium]